MLLHIGSLILKLGCLVYVAMGRYVVPDPNSPCIVVFDMPMHYLSSPCLGCCCVETGCELQLNKPTIAVSQFRVCEQQ